MARQDFLLQKYNYNGVEVYDFPLDDFYQNGVLQPTPYGDSDEQHKIDIIVNSQGAIKQFPLLGFGLFKYLQSETNSSELFNSLSSNMKMDGYFAGTGSLVYVKNEGFKIVTDKITNNY